MKYNSDNHFTIMLFVSFLLLYCLLLFEKDCCNCCHLLDEIVANKIQKSLRFREYYQEYGIHQKTNKGDEISSERVLFLQQSTKIRDEWSSCCTCWVKGSIG